MLPGRPLPSFLPGKPIYADDHNLLIKETKERLILPSNNGNFVSQVLPIGTVLALRVPGDFPVQLSGSGSPYSWTQVEPDVSGAWTTPPSGPTGTSNAYEANGVAGLNGKYVWLSPGFTNPQDFRFQALRYGGSVNYCVPVIGCSEPLGGALVQLKSGATVVASGTTPSTVGVITLTLTLSGSGYTNGTGYALTFTGGGGTGATGTFDVVSGTVTNVQLTAAGSGYTSAPTVGITGAGAGTGANITAAIGTQVCLSVTPGAYTLVVSATGYATSTTSVTVPTGTTSNPVTLSATTTAWTFAPRLCFCPPDAGHPVTIAITQTSGGSFTDTLNFTSSASQTVNVPCGGTSQYTIVYSSTNFTTFTGTGIGATCCSPRNDTTVLQLAYNGVCQSALNCLEAFPATLTATVPSFQYQENNGILGITVYTIPAQTITLATVGNVSGVWTWSGTVTITGATPAIPPLGVAHLTVTAGYTLNSPCTVPQSVITWSILSDSGTSLGGSGPTTTVCPITMSITLPGHAVAGNPADNGVLGNISISVSE